MSTYTIHNIDLLEKSIENLTQVFLSKDQEDIDIKFFNIENLTDTAWKRRYGSQESPIIELKSNEKYGKVFFSLDIKVKIENVEIKDIEIKEESKEDINKETKDISKKHFNIYCDGSCTSNPGGQIGSGVAIYENKKLLYGFAGDYYFSGTNNQAELNAFIFALKFAADLKEAKKVIIYADSQYVINSITEWAFGWEKKGWIKKGGIKNLELIKEAFNLYKKVQDFVEVKYVKAHSGIKGNEKADWLASVAVKKQIKNWVDYKN